MTERETIERLRRRVADLERKLTGMEGRLRVLFQQPENVMLDYIETRHYCKTCGLRLHIYNWGPGWAPLCKYCETTRLVPADRKMYAQLSEILGPYEDVLSRDEWPLFLTQIATGEIEFNEQDVDGETYLVPSPAITEWRHDLRVAVTDDGLKEAANASE